MLELDEIKQVNEELDAVLAKYELREPKPEYQVDEASKNVKD